MRDRETRGEKVGGRTMVRRGSKMFRRVNRMWDNLEENCREDVIFFLTFLISPSLLILVIYTFHLFCFLCCPEFDNAKTTFPFSPV